MLRGARSFAKLNLGLRVLGKRSDGFHEVETLLQSIDLEDRLTFRARRDGRLIVRADDPQIPAGPENLVWQALEGLRRHAGRLDLGMEAHLSKGIPPGTGLGGGSSDAACALAAANEIWELGLEMEDLRPLAARLGSDVPFFLVGGTCRARGRGEILEPLDPLEGVRFGLVIPPQRTATRDVYRRVSPPLTHKTPDARMVQQLIAAGDARELADLLDNDLEEAALAMVPELGSHMECLRALGMPIVRMTGSGSGFYFWPADERRVEEARVALAGQRCRVELVRTTSCGWVWDLMRR